MCYNGFMKERKPIIGIVAKYIMHTDDRKNALIRDEVRNAIIDNGGIAIAILPTEFFARFVANDKLDWEDYLSESEKQDLIAQISLCDGIVFQGGQNSLKYENWIAKYAYDNNIPTLGICAGQNTMVRALKGTTKLVTNPEKHNQKWVDEVHKIFVKKGMKFYDIVKCEEMFVNSRHKKTIDKLPENFIVSAVCDDSYYDVIEDPNKKFYLAVRFHPESLYKTHKEHKAIFEAFVDACK